MKAAGSDAAKEDGSVFCVGEKGEKWGVPYAKGFFSRHQYVHPINKPYAVGFR